MLDERRQTDHELAKCLERADVLERGQAVERHPLRFEVGDDLLDSDQPILEARQIGIIAYDPQPPVAFHLLEIESPAARVANQLISALLEGEQQTPFAVRRAAL